jgi:hypothetical protein
LGINYIDRKEKGHLLISFRGDPPSDLPSLAR